MDVTEAGCDLNDMELVNAVNALMEDLADESTTEGAKGTNININIIIHSLNLGILTQYQNSRSYGGCDAALQVTLCTFLFLVMMRTKMTRRLRCVKFSSLLLSSRLLVSEFALLQINESTHIQHT